MALFDAVLGLGQEARACPGQIALAELMALPVAGLAQAVDREVEGNPALEMVSPGTWQAAAGWDPDEVDRLAAPAAAADTILAELAVGPEDRWIAARILADLDSRGRLGRTPQEAAQWLGVPVIRVDRVLAALREVTSPDLAATDLREALRLQAAALPRAPDLLSALIDRHLGDVAAGRWQAIANALAVPEPEVASAVDYMRANLTPGTYDGATVGQAAPAPPDLVLCTDPCGGIRVLLTPAHPELHVDQTYQRIAANPAGLPSEVAARVKAQVASARDFLDRLALRDDLLTRIAQAVVSRQEGFVRYGARDHQPLTRNDIADEVGAHPSTVSRAVSGKTVRKPDGTRIPFADFFGAATSVCDLLAELVSAEAAPMSDADLVHALSARGVRVARRTVAKYRARLRIPAIARR